MKGSSRWTPARVVGILIALGGLFTLLTLYGCAFYRSSRYRDGFLDAYNAIGQGQRSGALELYWQGVLDAIKLKAAQEANRSRQQLEAEPVDPPEHFDGGFPPRRIRLQPGSSFPPPGA